MSRYGTINTGTAGARSAVVQSADPADLRARLLAAVADLSAGLGAPVIAAMTLAGAGDGHTFMVEVEVAEMAEVTGGLMLQDVVCFLGGQSEAVETARAAIASALTIADVQAAGASQGTRVMGMMVFGTVFGPDASSANNVLLFDDFLVGTSGANLGAFFWNTNTAGAGATARPTSTNIDAQHQGVIECTTGTTGGGRAGIRQGQATAPVAQTASNVSAGGTNTAFQEWLVRVETLSSAAQEFEVSVGWNDAITGGLFTTNAIQFVYQRAVFGTDWQAFARGGIATTTGTGVAVVAGAWVKLRIELAPAAGARFLINGVLVATIPQASLPGATAPFSPSAKIQKTAGAAPRRLFLDYAWLGYEFVTPR